MKDSIEYLKKCKVPTISENISLDKIAFEKVDQVKRRTYWGNDDFKSLVKMNMEGSKYGLRDGQ